MISLTLASELNLNLTEKITWSFVFFELQYEMNNKNKAHVEAVIIS